VTTRFGGNVVMSNFFNKPGYRVMLNLGERLPYVSRQLELGPTSSRMKSVAPDSTVILGVGIPYGRIACGREVVWANQDITQTATLCQTILDVNGNCALLCDDELCDVDAGGDVKRASGLPVIHTMRQGSVSWPIATAMFVAVMVLVQPTHRRPSCPDAVALPCHT
jgi:hypothetical protein